MWFLILGLVLFLGMHSLRVVGEGPRNRIIARVGEPRFKVVYSILSFVGLFLLIHGYGQARPTAQQLYAPPAGLSHLTLLLVPIALVLVVSAYVPTGRIKATVGHPMVLGVALWSFGHLLSNGTTADLVLFGAFLLWALADFVSSYRRTGGAATPAPHEARAIGGGGAAVSPRGVNDVFAVLVGLALTAAFLGGLHLWLFGVSPLG